MCVCVCVCVFVCKDICLCMSLCMNGNRKIDTYFGRKFDSFV